MITSSEYEAANCVACGKTTLADKTEEYPLCIDDQLQFENWQDDFNSGRLEFLREQIPNG